MRCEECGAERLEVLDSRPDENRNVIRRRRVCAECGSRITTIECPREMLEDYANRTVTEAFIRETKKKLRVMLAKEGLI